MMNDKNNLKISHIFLICFAQPTLRDLLLLIKRQFEMPQI